jgi:CBS domain-containing protein
MRQPVAVHVTEPLSEVSKKLAETGSDVGCILDDGELAGLVSRETLDRLARILDGTGE